MTTLEALRQVRELLSVKKHWIKGTNARNINGRIELAQSSNAICWCLEGAILNVCRDWTRGQDLADELEITTKKSLHNWNDAKCRTHPQVLALLDTTINRLEATCHD